MGQLQSLAIPFENYKLALTPGLASDVFGGKVTDSMLATEGLLWHSEGRLELVDLVRQDVAVARSGDTPAQELDYARKHFFLPRRFRDPFHTTRSRPRRSRSDDPYDLLVVETIDWPWKPHDRRGTDDDPSLPLVKNGLDYRVLQTVLLMDPNRNRSAVAFDGRWGCSSAPP